SVRLSVGKVEPRKVSSCREISRVKGQGALETRPGARNIAFAEQDFATHGMRECAIRLLLFMCINRFQRSVKLLLARKHRDDRQVGTNSCVSHGGSLELGKFMVAFAFRQVSERYCSALGCVSRIESCRLLEIARRFHALAIPRIQFTCQCNTS